jgi:hypothetical protein
MQTHAPWNLEFRTGGNCDAVNARRPSGWPGYAETDAVDSLLETQTVLAGKVFRTEWRVEA